ncbi:hypothetical protein DDE83_009013 [Stemphylium lycopersici]|uniref:Uncharacterized protein n=1 Tax=Stemphylium lycopersici TaxID=183478 RepID=A0A364MRL7_STELY|nr:hypothetical protein DDE83_009013 [Stemphylium lycopersici]
MSAVDLARQDGSIGVGITRQQPQYGRVVPLDSPKEKEKLRPVSHLVTIPPHSTFTLITSRLAPHLPYTFQTEWNYDQSTGVWSGGINSIDRNGYVRGGSGAICVRYNDGSVNCYVSANDCFLEAGKRQNIRSVSTFFSGAN